MKERMAINVSDIILRHKSEKGYVDIRPDARIKILSQCHTECIVGLFSCISFNTILSTLDYTKCRMTG